ncbi:hypothetical protein TVNIR_2432 [Thioalkalivibrio nitratireducens DSM 14787]|uniref:Cytochrome c domain-containing protein n=1 Tax=Thioalkalivibrio nitratireducens (strain DSM 14787 / UNIQEM 213 / ALEN2) TaxID=1255043 RepID=L0DYN6_THIND|nr:c-type cytochrome [Thioalkalivibrio nitratireducens]AGA34075.1 hypothetical protein TVNIR_2432 [Thioalkalivibrio nitratireducens DSM 14787]
MNTTDWKILVFLGLASFAVLACGSDAPKPPAVTIAEPGPIPASAQRPGDPDAGYHTLVNRGYVSCGIPVEAFQASPAPTEPGHSLPGREGLNAELPHAFNATVNADGVELVVSNCLTCHAADFEGELVVGLGNAFLDFTSDPAVWAEAFGAFVDDGPAAAAWAKWADRVGAIAPYMITNTVGVNPAPNLTMALIAHRDPDTLAWNDEPRLAPPPREPLPTKVPPWWRMQHKHAMFHHGAGRGDHVRFMMMKSLVCTDDLEEAREIDRWFADVRAFIASLEPPEFPFEIDRTLAKTGSAVFERHCAACHGTYDDSPTYPNLIVDLETVGTDPAYARQAVEADRFLSWFNGSFYGQGAEAKPALGYVAPPLDGVWATAPYLHNGSVPSITALFDSDSRPTFWRLQTDPPVYDPKTLGWRYQELPHGKDGAADPKEAKAIYDTTRHGYGNAGHRFGDSLDPDERRALIEYLKTL